METRLSAKNEKAKRFVIRRVAGISKRAEREQREFEALVRQRRYQAVAIANLPVESRKPSRQRLAVIALAFIVAAFVLFALAGR